MDSDHERIAKKAHELWEAEGRPYGRHQEHWDAAKEIVAMRDSGASMLKPRESGATPPVEEKLIAVDNEGEFPNLTDTGEHDLTSTARESAATTPPKTPSAKASAPKKETAQPAQAAAGTT